MGENPEATQARSAVNFDQVRKKKSRLKAGDAVCLEREDGDWMKGVVLAVEEDGIDVVVDGTIVEGEVFSVSRTVRGDARYTAAVEVVGAGPGQSRVRLMGDWKRVQMREFVRVAVLDQRVDVRSADRSGDDAGDSPEQLPRLVDLSAAGLCFESDASFARGQVLELEFSLPETGPITVRGEVIRVAGRRSRDARPAQYGIRFCGTGEATRVKIMTWVFAEQGRRFRESNKALGEPAV